MAAAYQGGQRLGLSSCEQRDMDKGAVGLMLTNWDWKEHHGEHLELSEVENLCKSAVGFGRFFSIYCWVARYRFWNENKR